MGANRKRWLFILFVATYILLDFADPQMPGAYVFDLARSVDGVSTNHAAARLHALPVAATPPQSGRMAKIPPANPRRASILIPIEWASVLRQAHSPSSDPPPPSEDH
jgi:hypothetical protein